MKKLNLNKIIQIKLESKHKIKITKILIQNKIPSKKVFKESGKIQTLAGDGTGYLEGPSKEDKNKICIKSTALYQQK